MTTDILTLAEEMEEALGEVTMLDAHTHLTGGKMSARGAHDVLLYHMVVSDLYAAGCPSGNRLTEFPGWPTREEARSRMIEALPYFPRIKNTSCSWGTRIILRDLYGWNEPVTADNWERLDGMIRERADDRTWQREILRRSNINKLTTELARRCDGSDDDILHYSMEWAFFTRTQRGEFDTALYELERCWGKTPGSPIPHGAGGRPPSDRVIVTLDDVHAAMDHFVGQLCQSPVLSIATHISTDIVFRPVSDGEMASALKRRHEAGPAERDIFASYVHDAFLAALAASGKPIAFQFSFAAEPMPHETASIVPQRAISHLADTAARHPKVKFVCFVASRHANQSICTLCRELPNFALAGYWWHNFFPDAIRQVIGERLDMLPVNKQVGFFSDAYCLEWTYGKTLLVRKQLARVLAEKIAQKQYSREDALAIAKSILYETSQTLLGMVPMKT
jgi:glucuronate isomerase